MQHLDKIKDARVQQKIWRFKVRILHLWMQPNFKQPELGDYLEMVVVDEEGDKIQATVKQVHLHKFKSTLKEMGSYIFAHVEVRNNIQRYKPCAHKYRLYFQYNTSVEQVAAPSEPNYGFCFTQFPRILDVSNNNALLVDIVGGMVKISNLNEYHTEEGYTKNVNLILEDLSGSKVNCVLWGDFADQILQYKRDHPDGPCVVVLQYAKTKSAYGSVEVSNTKFASRLLLNPDIPEVIELKSCMLARAEAGSLTLSQMSSQSSSSFEGDFLRNSVYKKLADVKQVTEPDKCLTYATVTGLVKRGKWWYNGCPNAKCTKGVSMADGLYYCEKYNKHWTSTIPMYKIEFVVEDDTDSAVLIVFAKEAEKLINVSATDLMSCIEEKGGDLTKLPPEVEIIKSKKILCKIAISKKNIEDPEDTTYQVQKVFIDETIIDEFKKLYNIQEKLIGSPSSTNANASTTVISLEETSIEPAASKISDNCSTPSVTTSSKSTSVLIVKDDDVQQSVVQKFKRIKKEK